VSSPKETHSPAYSSPDPPIKIGLPVV